MSTPQEYWDACLIRAWRNHGTVLDAMKMFLSITGKRTDEFPLLRLPAAGMPWMTSARIFTAYYLPKVSDWLWDKAPEKDVELLRKLTASEYTTEKTPYRTNADRDLQTQQRRTRVSRQKNEFTARAVSERNSDTDWGVTKGYAKSRVRK